MSHNHHILNVILLFLWTVNTCSTEARTTTGSKAAALACFPWRNPESIEIASCEIELGTDDTAREFCEVFLSLPGNQVLGLVGTHHATITLGETRDWCAFLIEQLHLQLVGAVAGRCAGPLCDRAGPLVRQRQKDRPV